MKKFLRIKYLFLGLLFASIVSFPSCSDEIDVIEENIINEIYSGDYIQVPFEVGIKTVTETRALGDLNEFWETGQYGSDDFFQNNDKVIESHNTIYLPKHKEDFSNIKLYFNVNYNGEDINEGPVLIYSSNGGWDISNENIAPFIGSYSKETDRFKFNLNFRSDWDPSKVILHFLVTPVDGCEVTKDYLHVENPALTCVFDSKTPLNSTNDWNTITHQFILKRRNAEIWFVYVPYNFFLTYDFNITLTAAGIPYIYRMNSSLNFKNDIPNNIMSIDSIGSESDLAGTYPIYDIKYNSFNHDNYYSFKDSHVKIEYKEDKNDNDLWNWTPETFNEKAWLPNIGMIGTSATCNKPIVVLAADDGSFPKQYGNESNVLSYLTFIANHDKGYRAKNGASITEGDMFYDSELRLSGGEIFYKTIDLNDIKLKVYQDDSGSSYYPTPIDFKIYPNKRYVIQASQYWNNGTGEDRSWWNINTYHEYMDLLNNPGTRSYKAVDDEGQNYQIIESDLDEPFPFEFVNLADSE